MKIFISGTAGFGRQTMTKLPDNVIEFLHDIMKNNYDILIGDCQGVDTLVQKILSENNYKNVTVYCSGSKCRNIIDTSWKTKNIFVPKGTTGRAFFAVKDNAMAKDADCALAIWDGKSQGTGTNIRNMRDRNKPVTIYRTDLNIFES